MRLLKIRKLKTVARRLRGATTVVAPCYKRPLIMNGESRDHFTRDNPTREMHWGENICNRTEKDMPFSVKNKYNIPRSKITTKRKGFIINSDNQSRSEIISTHKTPIQILMKTYIKVGSPCYLWVTLLKK